MVKKQLTKTYEAPAFTESRILAARTILAGSAEGIFEGELTGTAENPTGPTYTTASTHGWF